MVLESIVLTARHVVREIVDNGGAVLVRCRTGLWLCNSFWEDEPADLALLLLVKQLKKGDPPPQHYPPFANQLPALGMTLGYMARHDTVDKDTGTEHHAPAFFAGWVSRREPDFMKYPRFRLTPNYAIGGFSGAPVFLPTRELCAVHVRSHDLWVSLEQEKQVPFLFPEITPVLPALPSIQAAFQKVLEGQS